LEQEHIVPDVGVVVWRRRVDSRVGRESGRADSRRPPSASIRDRSRREDSSQGRSGIVDGFQRGVVGEGAPFRLGWDAFEVR